MATPKRLTIGSTHALHVYPEQGSSRSADAKFVDIVLSDEQALTLAGLLKQGALDSSELTIAAVRKPSVRQKKHHVTVTYESRKKK
jgi:hypothetical protein